MGQSVSRSELRHLVLMGVAGCGKSSVGAALSALTGLPYLDGDDLHSPESVARMRAGTPLTDQDRWPWLGHCGRKLADHPKGLILGCSALRRAYRDRLRDSSGMPCLLFVHLTGDKALLAQRMQARQGHYMPPALLQSQLETLEPPTGDENALTVRIDQPVEAIAAEIMARAC